MTLALAQEKLHYDVPQMEALSRQIQLGDLTPVMQIYEEDIKSPLKSAVGGTLLRTLFIQVQKAKVCSDLFANCLCIVFLDCYLTGFGIVLINRWTSIKRSQASTSY